MSVLELTKALLACPSLTPDEAGVHDILIKRLEVLDFKIEQVPSGTVANFWARRGTTAPLFVLAGHSDVVPTGPESAWSSNPFEPVERDGYLYGRGAVDMKGGLAAMVVAVEGFLKAQPQFQGSLAFLITSDEEGPSVEGTQKVVELLKRRGEIPAYCLIAEPSSERELGDQIRVGRRGSLHGHLRVYGEQEHIAYATSSQNPIHRALGALQKLSARSWDEGNAFFPPTSFQISNIKAGVGALNVTPAELVLTFNFRFSTAVTAAYLKEQVEALLQAEQLSYDLTWTLSGEPFLTKQGPLLRAVETVIQAELGLKPTCSTGGGTSDGRFIAPLGTEVIELGLCHETAHQVNERVKCTELEQLARLYQGILERVFTQSCAP